MSGFERNLRQTATYWAQTGLDKYGKPTFSAPTTIACRWEDRQELFIDKRGQETLSRARVFFAQAVDLEGYLYLGESAATDPLTLQDAFEIQATKKTPDLRNLKSLYVAML